MCINKEKTCSGFCWIKLHTSVDLGIFYAIGEAYSRRFVRPPQNLVQQITLKLLLPFKSNLVYR